jgi:hypothetical protein
MLRRTRLEPAESIEMLRSKNLKKYTDVYAVDGERLGVALRFVHRPVEDVNLELKYYRTYLIIQSILLGGTAFIPTVYVEDYDPAKNSLKLTADLDTLAELLWNREPDFVARGLGVFEELPD